MPRVTRLLQHGETTGSLIARLTWAARNAEICEDQPYDSKSDVWALGCILYELATLKRAFDGQSLPALVVKILRGRFPPLPARYSPDLKSLVGRMLSQHPAQRPSVEEILKLPWMRYAFSRNTN